MLVRDFFLMLLDDLLEEARHGSLQRHDSLGMSGVERAVDECRVAMASKHIKQELTSLLVMARRDCTNAEDGPEAWFWFSRLASVEWIAETVSVILMLHHQPLVVVPSMSAMLAVARIAAGMPSA